MKLPIQGLNCSFDHQERLYCGTQHKKLVCISSRNFKILGQINTKGSVNSISLGFAPNTLIIGQTGGEIAIVKINGDREDAGRKSQTAAATTTVNKNVLEKIKEVRLFDANISKVVRTTRNDIAIGTSKGIFFYRVNEEGSLEPAYAQAMLPECDITEMSEFAIDKYVVASWHSNDYLILDR